MKNSKENKNRATPIQKFQRTVEREKKNLRAGLSNAIRESRTTDIPSLVATLIKKPIYANLIASQPFPKQLNNRTHPQRLLFGHPDKALLWNACVVSTFAPMLARFTALKSQYEEELLFASTEKAWETLENIEAQFGYSIWLVKNKILTLQARSGIAAQKAYVRELLEKPGNNLWYGAIAYFKSAACEPSVSFDAMRDELSEMLAHGDLGSYVRYHLLPYDLHNIESTLEVLAYEEIQPIIDRFEAVIAMASLRYAQGDFSQNSCPYIAMSHLRAICDTRIDNLLIISEGIAPSLWAKSLDRNFDAYMMGNYELAFSPAPHLLELEASIAAISDQYVPRKDCQENFQAVIDSMKEHILMSEKKVATLSYLKKVALSYAPHPIVTTIAAFLERKHDYIQVDEFSVLDHLAALHDFQRNPWSAFAVTRLIRRPDLIDAIARHSDTPSSIQLMSAVQRGDYENGVQWLDSVSLPLSRAESYKGHIALKAGKNREAVRHYMEAISLGNSYVSKRVSVHLFSALFSLECYQECMSLVLDQCLAIPSALPLFPLIEELISSIATNRALSRTLEYAVLVHLVVGTSVNRMSTSISDAVENFLLAEGLTRPSELNGGVDKYHRGRLIYFLRHVITSKVLEELTIFDDTQDVDRERIRICQILCELDPAHTLNYAAEIKEITRNENNAELLRMVQSSKVFVDEEELLKDIEPAMRELYDRFIECRQLPESKTDSVGISQMLGDLFGKDLAPEEQASSELENLFGNILHHFAARFATHAAYGLNTHISTSIRHHAFEGHFRSAFDKEELLCLKQNAKSNFQMAPYWRERLNDLPKGDIVDIEKAMVRFTETVITEIRRYLTELLHIKHPQSHPTGMINLIVDKQARLALLDEMKLIGSYEEFSKKILDYCWTMVDRSLMTIRSELSETTLQQINRDLARLEKNIVRLPAQTEGTSDLLNAIVRARTNFQVSIDELCSWFHRPKELSRVPFDMDSAVDVSMTQLHNCWSAVTSNIGQTVNVPFKVDGRCLDGLVEILFIFMQNIIIHSGQPKTNVRGEIDVSSVDGGISIAVENPIAPTEDLNAIREEAALALRRHQSDREQLMKKAGTEGQSGLSKVWWLLEFDLKRPYQLDLEVTDDRAFKALLKIQDVRVSECMPS